MPAALQTVFSSTRTDYNDCHDEVGMPPESTSSGCLAEVTVGKAYLFQNSVSVSGSLHMLHSIVKYLSDELPNFHTFFWKPFKALVDFLRHRECRKLLVHRCFSDPPASTLQSLFTNFTASLTDHFRFSFASYVPI